MAELEPRLGQARTGLDPVAISDRIEYASQDQVGPLKLWNRQVTSATKHDLS